MGKKTAQPETATATAEAFAAPAPDPMENDLHSAQLEATIARDRTLLCDGCRERLDRAHAGDERERNARYPEVSQG